MKKTFIAICSLLVSALALADEGMWLVNSIDSRLESKMRQKGLKLSADQIYSTDNVSLKDAIVSMDFIGTGSFVSKDGLVITNHHVAYSDVFSLSTKEHNYLEDGFWARTRQEEIKIPGKTVQLLDRMVEITDEVQAYIDKEKAAGKPVGMRKLSFVFEKKYKKEYPGFEISLDAMWGGSKYYLSLYKTLSDVRLVAAPPVSISAYGGDIDNWEWPQHKCDFAMYRVYDENGEPYHPAKYLKIGTKGLKMGDFTMVMGYPGRTDRYTSSSKLQYRMDTELPIMNEVRGEQMRIISGWMAADPDVRLKYADRFFSLSNVQELQEGESLCFERFGCLGQKIEDEKLLVDGGYGAIIGSLDSVYAAIRAPKRNALYFRESLIRGSKLSIIATRLKNRAADLNIDAEYAGLDLRVEKDLFAYGVKVFYQHVDSSFWGSFQKSLYKEYRGDSDAIAAALWIDRPMTKKDDIFRFLNDISYRDFNKAVDDVQGPASPAELGKRYTRAMYAAREKAGILQYPDANSTMRLTYGTIGSFERDGQILPYRTFGAEILQKEDTTKYEFTLKPDWRELLEKQGRKIPVNFISDTDITGGNSGSPVINGRGELVGLAFDGNKESLAGDVSFTDGFNKTVSVDIRYVLWTLKHYAGMDSVLSEMEIR